MRLTALALLTTLTACATAPQSTVPDLAPLNGKTLTACTVRHDAGKLWLDVYADYSATPSVSVEVAK